MWGRLKSLWNITAIRLSIAYTLAFGIMAVMLVFYMTGGAVDYLRQQFRTSINEEMVVFDRIYRTNGIAAVTDAMERRSRAPGANLYVISDPTGKILAGNVHSIEAGVLTKDGWIMHPFSYERFLEGASERTNRAVARTLQLPNGMRLLIGQDIGEPERFREVIRRALSWSMAAMLFIGFFIWFFVGRRALKRIDLVSRSTERILAGDQSERLPVTGANDEFDRLSKRMNVMLDRIFLLDTGLRNVSDSIAHDLKTPLTRLRNKADAALASATDPGSEEALSQIIADSDQLIKTFNALLMISRVEAGSQVAEFADLDMSAIVTDVAELYEPVAEEEGFELVVRIAPNIKVRGNRELISQAISNLLDNALKYGHAKKGRKQQVILALRESKSEICVEASDHGAGIPAEKREAVKERFVRLDESRSKPGNGLGLALVDAIAKLHGGRLDFADNSPGLVVTLAFPK